MYDGVPGIGVPPTNSCASVSFFVFIDRVLFKVFNLYITMVENETINNKQKDLKMKIRDISRFYSIPTFEVVTNQLTGTYDHLYKVIIHEHVDHFAVDCTYNGTMMASVKHVKTMHEAIAIANDYVNKHIEPANADERFDRDAYFD